MSDWHVAATYSFFPLENPAEHVESLESEAARLDVGGIFVLAPEGLNTTCAASSREKLDAWIRHLEHRFGIELEYKYSTSHKQPFRRLAMKVRSEICTTGNPDLRVDNSENNHIPPEEWDRMIAEEDPVIIDTRNRYEYELGTFRGAINPKTDKFSDFFQQVDQMDIPKDKKVMIFCTGGIRCHKGIHELQQRGYSNIYQLEGGILKYMEVRPDGYFDGSCFVFDHRVAVGKDLKPVAGLHHCVHCGNPAREDITCARCDGGGHVCRECRQDSVRAVTCSKDCANHWAERPGVRSKRLRSAGKTAQRSTRCAG